MNDWCSFQIVLKILPSLAPVVQVGWYFLTDGVVKLLDEINNCEKTSINNQPSNCKRKTMVKRFQHTSSFWIVFNSKMTKSFWNNPYEWIQHLTLRDNFLHEIIVDFDVPVDHSLYVLVNQRMVDLVVLGDHGLLAHLIQDPTTPQSSHLVIKI